MHNGMLQCTTAGSFQVLAVAGSRIHLMHLLLLLMAESTSLSAAAAASQTLHAGVLLLLLLLLLAHLVW
jgi:hypothetical protein